MTWSLCGENNRISRWGRKLGLLFIMHDKEERAIWEKSVNWGIRLKATKRMITTVYKDKLVNQNLCNEDPQIKGWLI